MDVGYGPLVDPNLIVQAVTFLAIVGLPALLVLLLVAANNRLVGLQNNIAESWSNVDTELRRRYDLIPNLVRAVQGYVAHERSVFEAVTNARSKAMEPTVGPQQQSEIENELVHSLRQLMAVSESYPDLKADGNFMQLQEELVITEDRIQAARRFFNGNVREFNTLIQSFPLSLIAGSLGFRSKQYFEIEELKAGISPSVVFRHRS